MPSKTDKLTVAVLMGGPSSEHEVSLRSGGMVVSTLHPDRYHVLPVMVSRANVWSFPNGEGLDVATALSYLKRAGIDVAFNVIHGEFGEDGTVQALLEDAGIAYTGSGVAASRLAMDKRRAAEVLATRGVRVPESREFLKIDWDRDDAAKQAILAEAKLLGIPSVVKPANLGSSVGVTIVHAPDTLPYALEKAFSHSSEVLVQEYIKGDEVTCGVLDEGGDHAPVALPPTQIIPKITDFFDYEAKYQPGASEEITPARVPEKVREQIQEIALIAHTALCASGLSRTDMIVRDGEVYYLETNTLPGFTATSLYPQAAEVAGIPSADLLDKLIAAALRKKGS